MQVRLLTPSEECHWAAYCQNLVGVCMSLCVFLSVSACFVSLCVFERTDTQECQPESAIRSSQSISYRGTIGTNTHTQAQAQAFILEESHLMRRKFVEK